MVDMKDLELHKEDLNEKGLASKLIVVISIIGICLLILGGVNANANDRDLNSINVYDRYEVLLKVHAPQEQIEFSKILLEFNMQDKAERMLRAVINNINLQIATKEDMSYYLTASSILRDYHKEYIETNFPEIADKVFNSQYKSAAYHLTKPKDKSFDDVVDIAIKEASYLGFGPGVYLETFIKYPVQIEQSSKDKIINFYKQMAEEGNKRSKMVLGNIYMDGYNAIKNEKLAVQYLKGAADNFGEAAQRLSIYYNLKKNEELFIYYAKKASDLEESSSSYNVGLYYVSQNKNKQALEYFYKALEQDPENYEVYYDIGRMYAEGLGVDRNNEIALKIVEFAYLKIDRKVMKDLAFHMLGYIHKNRGIEAFNKKDYETAFNEFTIAMEKYNDPVAMYELAVMYFNGNYVQKDDAKTIELYKKSADLGFYKAQFWLGFRYFNGRGIEQNRNKSEYYIKLSADQNYPEALIMMYFFSKDSDLEKAKSYLYKAKKQGLQMAIDIWNKEYKEEK